MSQFCSVLGAQATEPLLDFKLWQRENGQNWPYSYKRGAFAWLWRQKSSKLRAVPCGFILKSKQNRGRLNPFLIVHRP